MEKNRGFISSTRKPFLYGLITFVLSLSITFFLVYQNYLLFKSEQKQSLVNEANTIKNRIESSLKYSLNVTSSLGLIIERIGFPENFDELAKILIESNQHIDAIQFVNPTGTITHVFPLPGNETVIGYNIFEDERRVGEAKKAIEKKQLYFAGPFKLKQGYIGSVGRLPLFRDNEFIGLIAVIVKMETLIEATWENQLNQTAFEYQISKFNEEKKLTEHFLNSDKAFNPEEFISLPLDYGDWFIHVKYRSPIPFSSIIPFSIAGLVFSFLAAFFVHFLVRLPEELEKQVQEKTDLLLKQDLHFKALVEFGNDAIFVMNEDATISYVSPSITRVLGFSPSEIHDKSLQSFIHKDDVANFEIQFENCLKAKKNQLHIVSYRLRHKTLGYTWVESNFSNLLSDSSVHGIVNNLRDVSERLNNTLAIQAQNDVLKEIAWTQSHVVRAPLARLMSLVNLINDVDEADMTQDVLFSLILQSANELDEIIKQIILKTEKIDLKIKH